MFLRIEERRGHALEGTHPVSAIVVEPSGRVVHRVGDDLDCTWRSAAKPFQLAVSSVLAEVSGLAPEDLAIGASSHSAQPEHVARVRALMARFSVAEEHLFCGAHWPVHEPSGHDLAAAGGRPSALHNNCSGKHTFMAAACQVQGWEPDYRAPEHPLQVAIRERITALSGVEPSAVIDGCGVPCWVLPLSAMARAWAGMAVADGRLGEIRDAMAANPFWFSGTDRDDGDQVAAATEPLVLKVGARGLMCGALPQRGLGFALKVHTGDGDARAVATAEVLERFFPGLVAPVAVQPWRDVRNVVGRLVGERVAVWA